MQIHSFVYVYYNFWTIKSMIIICNSFERRKEWSADNEEGEVLYRVKDIWYGKVRNISIVRVQTMESSIINGAIRQNVLRNKFRIPQRSNSLDRRRDLDILAGSIFFIFFYNFCSPFFFFFKEYITQMHSKNTQRVEIS